MFKKIFDCQECEDTAACEKCPCADVDMEEVAQCLADIAPLSLAVSAGAAIVEQASWKKHGVLFNVMRAISIAGAALALIGCAVKIANAFKDED